MHALTTAESQLLAGVYLLTPDSETRGFASVIEVVEQALHAGVRAVQYRDKTAGMNQRVERARQLVALTRAAGALLIVNDSVEVALESDADGVHIGRDDGDVAAARRRLAHRLLGVSCYNDLGHARTAVAAGADAIAFGSMFASLTKPAAVRAPPVLLSEARATWPEQRVVAIGGIDLNNIATVAAAGAHAAAVINAVFGATHPGRAVRELIQRFDDGKARRERQA